MKIWIFPIQGCFFILSYFLPLLLIVCLYSVMLHTLWYKVILSCCCCYVIHSSLQSPGGIVSKDALRNKKRVVKLVTIVTVMFSLSWLPIQLILLLKSFELYQVTIFNILVQVSYYSFFYMRCCKTVLLMWYLGPARVSLKNPCQYWQFSKQFSSQRQTRKFWLDQNFHVGPLRYFNACM